MKINGSARLGKDIEVRYTNTGKAVANFPVAFYQGKEKESGWLNVVVWGALAENCGNTLRKGQMVVIDGRLTMRTYEKDDQKQRVYEIVADQVGEAISTFEEKGEAVSTAPYQSFGDEIPDGDIPF